MESNFIIFEGFLDGKNCLRPETATLTLTSTV